MLQGSEYTPAIWLAVSLVLTETYNKKFKSKGIPDPTSTKFLTKLLDSFVDDTDLWDIVLTTTTTQQLTSRMKTRAQFWKKILFATGGQLNLNKCYWYLI